MAGALGLLAGCAGELPPGRTEFTLGRTTVRTDSVLDVVGVVFRLADTSTVPPVGPIRRWHQALVTAREDSAFAAGAALGPAPIGPILLAYAERGRPETACGLLAPSTPAGPGLAPALIRCFRASASLQHAAERFVKAATAFVPRAVPLVLAGLDDGARRRDLSDVWIALRGRSPLDSVINAYAGYADLSYDVTLARTFWAGQVSPPMDPTGAQAPGAGRIFLGPDPTHPTRSYRAPSYVWLALSHQMAHVVVARLLSDHPELAEQTLSLRAHVESEMNRVGYSGLFWDESLGEQLARAITIRVLGTTRRPLVWAARTEALSTNMSLVPWLEDALKRYEQARDSFPSLSAFAGELVAALRVVPVDSCRAAPSPGIALVAVARRRAEVRWLAADSPLRARGLLEGDTVIAIDGDSVSAGGLLVPTRHMLRRWDQHLPFELARIGIIRGGRTYEMDVPVNWVTRGEVRIPSLRRPAGGAAGAGAAAGGELQICRWVRSAVRQAPR